uniref:ZP domain-containing protein n=1 Tax=Haemonchus contortus TaxID=6289 RepID=A0A7I4Y608_HAECO
MSATGTWPYMYRRYLTICSVWFAVCTLIDGYGLTYKEPRLECLTDGIRLHIDPVGVFVGHVYVAGHFIGDKCHLDYCRQSIHHPFVMEVPYRGDCNVRRHRSPHPMTISYEVTVVIQHHPLFITAGDRAYRLNCIYRQLESTLTQKININDLSATALEASAAPSCFYDVLTAVNGPRVQMANVGDPIVHKWTCSSDKHGFLVHSCVVRDQSGNEYNLIDERGCVIEKNLVPDVTYASDLSYAYTTISAFRFAEQLMVNFACEITLCRKNEQGCEGITPPTCYPIDFPPIKAVYKHSTTTTAIPSWTAAPESNPYGIDAYSAYDTVYTRPNTTTSSSNTLKANADQGRLPSAPSTGPSAETETYASSLNDKEFGIEISNRIGDAMKAKQMRGYHTETLSSVFDLPAGEAMEPLPSPPVSGVYHAVNRKARSNRRHANDITVDVESKRIFILSSDDSERLGSSPLRRSDVANKDRCDQLFIGQTVLLCVATVLQVSSIIVIIVQRRIYNRNIRALRLNSGTHRY